MPCFNALPSLIPLENYKTSSGVLRSLVPNSSAVEKESIIKLVGFKSHEAMSWIEKNNVPCVFIVIREKIPKIFLSNSSTISSSQGMCPKANVHSCFLWIQSDLLLRQSGRGSGPRLSTPRATPGRDRKTVHSLLHNEHPFLHLSLTSEPYLLVCKKESLIGLEKRPFLPKAQSTDIYEIIKSCQVLNTNYMANS